MALNCNIPKFTKWDRKQYYYPDLAQRAIKLANTISR